MKPKPPPPPQSGTDSPSTASDHRPDLDLAGRPAASTTTPATQPADGTGHDSPAPVCHLSD